MAMRPDDCCVNVWLHSPAQYQDPKHQDPTVGETVQRPDETRLATRVTATAVASSVLRKDKEERKNLPFHRLWTNDTRAGLRH